MQHCTRKKNITFMDFEFLYRKCMKIEMLCNNGKIKSVYTD